MRGKRAKDIRRALMAYMKDKGLDMRKFKGYYRRTKKDYMNG